MLNKIIGVILVGAAVYIWFGYGPSKRESRSSITKMLLSIILTFVCGLLAYCGIQIFNGNALNLF